MKLKDADKIKEAISRSYKALSLRGEVYLSEDAIMLIVPLLKKVMRYIQGGKRAFVQIAELRC